MSGYFVLMKNQHNLVALIRMGKANRISGAL